jgi:Retinoblastoma-associated protein A domain
MPTRVRADWRERPPLLVRPPALQASRMYWRVLESMLASEERRTGRTALQELLGSELFHKCLVALCVEVVVASYRMVRPLSPSPQTTSKKVQRFFLD